MLAIARALMARPKLLMLDEPSLGLAPMVVKVVFDIIAMLKAQGVTILLVEQNIHQALKVADRACVIKTGRISMTGTGSEILSDPDIQKAYMDLYSEDEPWTLKSLYSCLSAEFSSVPCMA